MTLRSKEFLLWVKDQEMRPLREQIRLYLEGQQINPTKRQFESLSSGMYARLRKTDGKEFPSIAYTPGPPRPPRDTTPIKFSESTALAPVADAIVRDGYSLARTTKALSAVQVSHANAPVGQQKAVGELVESLTGEITVRDVQLANANEMLRIRAEIAADQRASIEDARRNTVFLQQLMTKGRAGGDGGSVI